MIENFEHKIPEHQEDKLIKISKLHFLIHPGYLSDKRYRYAGYGEKEIGKFNSLLDKYIEHAKKLAENELMVIFTHTEKDEVRNDLRGELYLRKIQEIKKVLGDRAIIIIMGIRDLIEQDISNIKKIANARGYDFDENVLSDAYGEMMENCVYNGARDLNMAGKFKNKTIIKPYLTELNSTKELQTKHLIKIKKRYRKKNAEQYVNLEIHNNKK